MRSVAQPHTGFKIRRRPIGRQCAPFRLCETRRDTLLTMGEAADAVPSAARRRADAVLAEVVPRPESHQRI